MPDKHQSFLSGAWPLCALGQSKRASRSSSASTHLSVCRFSDHACFASIPRGDRGRRWLDKALHSFNCRTEPISISALQGTILLGMACFAEGETGQEDLLSAQAIRMVQVMQLPDVNCADAILFEIQVRRMYRFLTGCMFLSL